MAHTFYLLLGHAIVAADAFGLSAELSQSLVKGGVPKTTLGDAETLAHKAEELLVALESTDRIADHNVHIAVTELEMWMQTVAFLLKKSIDDTDLVDQLMGAKIHSHDHTVTVVAQALRVLGSLRTNLKVPSALGDERKIHDVCGRGWTLLSKLLKTTELRHGGIEGAKEKLEGQKSALLTWLTAIDEGAKSLTEKQIPLLGILGHVPAGRGLPLGGASFGVVLHESAQGDVPDPANAGPTSGWSVGRQGRNNENLGHGWIEPIFR